MPVVSNVAPGPVDRTLAGRLSQLVAQARAGSGGFDSAIDQARRAAAAAGAPQSESWVVAQQALSAAVAARTPVTRALGDIDELAANALATRGGLGPADLAAIESAAAEVGAIDGRQAAAIDALQARLGS